MIAQTTVYFIRHCMSDYMVSDPVNRPLTEKGLIDRIVVTRFLREKHVSAVLSSPYKRAIDTISDFAEKAKLKIELINDFRERESDSNWDRKNDFYPFFQRQWSNFDYTISDGETLRTVQTRNIKALSDALKRYAGQNIAIGTHGMALSAIINYYDKSYGYDDFIKMLPICPFGVKMVFDGQKCIDIRQIDILKTVI